MVTFRSGRGTTRTAAIPDDRAVIGCALTALAALLLMLMAGTAKAEQPELVCWSVETGKLECESRASIEDTCKAIDQKHELCIAVQRAQSAAPLYFPGNTKYTMVKLTKAGKEFWTRNKPRVMP
ncbi:MAG TPA: hypothetical protein VJV39_22430 [Dongiaceae bacterium]|nr:hypothetical protein [Dongiaceae bacterium]